MTTVRKPGHWNNSSHFDPARHRKEKMKSEPKTVMINKHLLRDHHVHESTSECHLNPMIISWWRWKWSWVETKRLHIIWGTKIISSENRHIDRRKFRSQTSDNMDRWKAEQGRGRETRKIRREKSRRERVRRKKMQVREKVGKSQNTVFFKWFVAPEGRKVGSLKRRVRSQLARWEMKNCTPLWREAHSKSKRTKHLGLGALLEVEMSKKCTPLWREAHFEVKMYKTNHSQTTFGSWDVEKVHAVVREAHFEVKMYKTPQPRTTFGSWDVEKVHAVVARSTCRSQNVKSTRASYHFWRFRCRFASLHYITLHSTTLHYTTLHNTTTTTTQLHSTTPHYTPLHSTTLHYTRYTKSHYTTLHYTTLH